MPPAATDNSTHIPDERLSHAVALARRPAVLEGGVGHIGLQVVPLGHALHKNGVPAAESGHREDAHQEGAIVCPAQQDW